MTKQVDVIDEIFTNIDALHESMLEPLTNLKQSLQNIDTYKQKEDDYKQSAKNIISLINNIDKLIDTLPPYHALDDTKELDEKIKELEERNRVVDQNLKDIVQEANASLTKLKSIDSTMKDKIINSD